MVHSPLIRPRVTTRPTTNPPAPPPPAADDDDDDDLRVCSPTRDTPRIRDKTSLANHVKRSARRDVLKCVRQRRRAGGRGSAKGKEESQAGFSIIGHIPRRLRATITPRSHFLRSTAFYETSFAVRARRNYQRRLTDSTESGACARATQVAVRDKYIHLYKIRSLL